MTDMTPQTQKQGPTRVEKTNSIVDVEAKKILDEVEILSSDLDAIMEVLKDRLVQSTDPSFPIALARLMEIRMDGIKKKTDILKVLVNDKGIEVMGKKKSPTTDLESILSGAAFGAALGAKVGSGGFGQGAPRKEISNDPEHDIIDTIDVSNEEFIVDTEQRGSSDAINKLLSGE